MVFHPMFAGLPPLDDTLSELVQHLFFDARPIANDETVAQFTDATKRHTLLPYFARYFARAPKEPGDWDRFTPILSALEPGELLPFILDLLPGLDRGKESIRICIERIPNQALALAFKATTAENPDRRTAALWIIGTLGETETCVRYALEALSDTELQCRRMGIWMAQNHLAHSAIMQVLLELTNDDALREDLYWVLLPHRDADPRIAQLVQHREDARAKALEEFAQWEQRNTPT